MMPMNYVKVELFQRTGKRVFRSGFEEKTKLEITDPDNETALHNWLIVNIYRIYLFGYHQGEPIKDDNIQINLEIIVIKDGRSEHRKRQLIFKKNPNDGHPGIRIGNDIYTVRNVDGAHENILGGKFPKEIRRITDVIEMSTVKYAKNFSLLISMPMRD